jgi:RimJ/RimL family protein N-acetyltransferase
MDRQYVAQSSRIRLRLLEENDFSFFLELFNNVQAMEYFPEHRDSEKTKAWIEFNFDHYDKYEYGKWVIENHKGELMGHSGLVHTMIDGEDRVELGYFLHPLFWRQGFATEAARLGMKLAFSKYHLYKLVSAINPSNFPSIKVAERLGMKKEKTATASVGSMSWLCDVYAIVRSE